MCAPLPIRLINCACEPQRGPGGGSPPAGSGYRTAAGKPGIQAISAWGCNRTQISVPFPCGWRTTFLGTR